MKQTLSQSANEGTVSPLRYSIKTRLANMPAAVALDIKQKVRKETGTTRSSMSRFLNEKASDPKHYMPATVLQAYAKHLAVRMEDLLNK
jgi:hypothetical protein